MQIDILRVHTRTYTRMYTQEFKPAELSRQELIFHPIKGICEAHAQPTDIDAMVIYVRISAYVHTYNSQHICTVQYWPSALPSVAHTLVDGVKKYESSLTAGCLKVASIANDARKTKSEYKKKFFFFSFWHWCNTCINVTVSDLASKFLLEILVISMQKHHTKMPKWCGEPNDLKVALGEQTALEP